MVAVESASQTPEPNRPDPAYTVSAGSSLVRSLISGRGSASHKSADTSADVTRLGEWFEGELRQPDRAGAFCLREFLGERSVPSALRQWFGADTVADKGELVRRLNRDVAVIDRLITDQVNAILHHPRFQQLEAIWRGVFQLIDQIDEHGEPAIVRILNLSAKELTDDLELAVEFDQSELFRKVYSEEFGQAGGRPYGVLIGDYEVCLRPSITRGPATTATRDIGISTVRRVAQVAAAAFCPFIAAASPTLLGIDDFSALEHTTDLRRLFGQLDYLPWRRLREDEHSRFVGLAVPRVLVRQPYQSEQVEGAGFIFQEDVSGPDHSKYLWGSAAFPFGSVVIRSFQEMGWLADIRGVRQDEEAGGLVTSLPVHCFDTDHAGVTPKFSTDLSITDDLENQLGDLGFLPLCYCKDTTSSAFYVTPSIQRPQEYDRLSATLNAKISAMLQYVFCVSRFAHYLKSLARDKVGNLQGPSDCQKFLQNWIAHYVTPDANATPRTKARYPLRKADVRVEQRVDEPGHYECVIYLWPHYALDELSGAIQVQTVLETADRS